MLSKSKLTSVLPCLSDRGGIFSDPFSEKGESHDQSSS